MSWDDGSHNKVKKVEITYDEIINSIQVTYDGANLQSQRRGSVGPKFSEFTLGSDEYITALSAYSKTVGTQDVVTALTFTTNKTTYGPYGNKTGYQISAPEATGKQIAGFLGTSSNVLNEIDVHYGPLPTTGGGGSEPGGGSGSGSGAQKLDAQGGTGGTKWDDGSDYDGVTKITVRSSNFGVQLVKFVYAKGGQVKEGATHGVMAGRGSAPKEIVINHPADYLVSVEGWYDSSNIIQGIRFITNKERSDLVGFEPDGSGTSFTLQVKDKKIIGFHGFAGDHLNSIGAYFVPLSSTTPPSTSAKKLKAEGGDAGDIWDDGAYDDVKKVYIGQGDDGISFVKFEYLKGSQVTYKDGHGQKTKLKPEEFELGAGEYIISVEGTYDKIAGAEKGIVTMLKFKTNLRTSIPFGLEGSLPFTLKEEGYKIVGFHGQAKDVLHSIGAYVAPLGLTPLTPATSSVKLEGHGGDSGALWDDGAFDGVKKVYVGQAHEGIGAVKFVYDKGAQEVKGAEHGTRGQLGYEVFELDYPNEYITAVEGTYDTIFGAPGPVVTMLRFKTNKQTSIPFGIEAGTAFSITKEGHKIVGFHGKASDLLYNFGVHVSPITK